MTENRKTFKPKIPYDFNLPDKPTIPVQQCDPSSESSDVPTVSRAIFPVRRGIIEDLWSDEVTQAKIASASSKAHNTGDEELYAGTAHEDHVNSIRDHDEVYPHASAEDAYPYNSPEVLEKINKEFYAANPHLKSPGSVAAVPQPVTCDLGTGEVNGPGGHAEIVVEQWPDKNGEFDSSTGPDCPTCGEQTSEDE